MLALTSDMPLMDLRISNTTLLVDRMESDIFRSSCVKKVIKTKVW